MILTGCLSGVALMILVGELDVRTPVVSSTRTCGRKGVRIDRAFAGASCALPAGALRSGNAAYFALVTGLTVGYGDITPVTPIGKAASAAIAVVGVITAGI